jgi:hypothetical protein
MTGRSIAAELVLIGLLFQGLSARGDAQSRETLETKVTGSGGLVFLKWGKKHPWAAELQARGASLMIEYATERGKAGIDCLVMTAQAADPRQPRGSGGCGVTGIKDPDDDRTLRFRLPSRLTSPPKGNVCLYFQLPDRRVLPIRKADQQGRETARFQYPPWSDPLSRQAEVASAERRVIALREAVVLKRIEIERQQAINDRNQWKGGQCEGIPAPQLSQQGEALVRPLAPPADRDAFARQVCVMRLVNADEWIARVVAQPTFKGHKQLASFLSGRAHGIGTIELALGLLSKETAADPGVQERRAESEAFRRDWAAYAPNIRAYVQGVKKASYSFPHFGDFEDVLALQTMTRSIGKSIYDAAPAGSKLETRDVLGYIGGTLDTYALCVSDGKAQMETAYDAYQQLKSRTPQLQEAARQQLVRACAAGVGKLQQLEAELAALQQELATAEAAMGNQPDQAAAASADVTELNGAACRAGG